MQNRVNAGSVLKVFRSDPNADLLKQGFLMSQPMVRALNRVQKCDKLVSNLRHIMNVEPEGEAARTAKRLAADMNWRFLSGNSGIHPRFIGPLDREAPALPPPGKPIGVGRLMM